MVTLKVRWPWKLGKGQQNLIYSSFCDTIHKFSAIVQFKKYTENLFWSKFDISKCSYDLENKVKVTKIFPPNNLSI